MTKNSLKNRLSIPSSLLRNFVIFLIVLGVVFVSRQISKSQSPFSATATEQAPNRYVGIDKLDTIIGRYQKNTNDLFNVYIKELNEKFPKMKDEARMTLISPPPLKKDKQGNPTGEREKCTNENRSTYCLSLAAVHDYFLFREALIELRNKQRGDAEKVFEAAGQVPYEQRSIGGALKDLVTGQKTVQEYGQIFNEIDRELEVSRQALDQSLAAYNELQMALPLHHKYKEVIKSLEKYRDQVSSIRKIIEQFPPTFLNVTTSSCT